jgi:hypothetical protein
MSATSIVLSIDGFAPAADNASLTTEHCARIWGPEAANSAYVYGHHTRQIFVAATRKPTRVSDRVNRLPRWAQHYIMRVHTFVGAEEVEEFVYLRDQNRALIKLVGELACPEKDTWSSR